MVEERQETLFTHARKFIYINQIGVKPELKRKGIGTRLIASVKEFCRVNDLNRIVLDVSAFNEKARNFFEK